MADVRPQATRYVEMTTGLTQTAITDPAAARALMPAFEREFDSLAEALPSVADAVTAAKDAHLAEANSAAAVEAITQIRDVVNRINETQSLIAAAVEEQTATTGEIVRSISETRRSTVVIETAVREVSDANAATVSGAANSEEAAGEVATLASHLRQLVGRFRY